MAVETNSMPKNYFEFVRKDKYKHTKEKKPKTVVFDEIDYYVHKETKNKSFIKMYKVLNVLGVKNNTFFLKLYDERLKNIDPRDPDLDVVSKQLVLNECKRNLWYFIREVVRIPDAGSDAENGGTPYKLHRGNLALTWAIDNNLNIFVELPRQNGKSISVDILLLWLYNFGTSSSDMMVMNKEHKDAKDNLSRIKAIRDSLPSYLRFNKKFNEKGVELKTTENVVEMTNEKTKNRLITKPSATSEEKADKLGRGCTQPIMWFDEWAFLKFNMTIYESAAPAFSQASLSAASHGKPYSKIITTTPGDLQTQFGLDAYNFRNDCIRFNDCLYDEDIENIKSVIENSSKNGFLLISYNYKQLGRSEKWFKSQVQGLAGKWIKIRREILLEWISVATNSPFDDQDLYNLKSMMKQPIRPMMLFNKYIYNIYKEVEDYRYPVIMGVDVAAGTDRDSSAIAVIDSRTKEIIGEFNNPLIDTTEFAKVINLLATQVYPSSVIFVENNGIGGGVISALLGMEARHNLYFEKVENQLERKMVDGRLVNTNNAKLRYGIHNDAEKRQQMEEILLRYVKDYKERICTEYTATQILGLVINKKGRMDHQPDGHDDSVMAYLLGMYGYFFGKGLSTFKLHRFPDVDPEKEREEIEKQQEEIQRRIKANKDISFALTSATDYDEMTLSDKLLLEGETKTTTDYVKELDREAKMIDMLRDREMKGESSVQFSNTFGQVGFNNNPFGQSNMSSDNESVNDFLGL